MMYPAEVRNRPSRGRPLRAMVALIALVLAGGCATLPVDPPATAAGARAPQVRLIAPATTHAANTRFNEAHYIALDPARDRADAPLVLFMAGTGGKPREMPFFPALLHAGHRVISISYNTAEAIQQVCPAHPDSNCAAKTRQRRLYGTATIDVIDDAPHEAIVPRLVALLKHLDRGFPGERWNRYLAGDGIAWGRVIVSGQSQGAGMAAYLAKDHAVARAVLFSSPWDSSGRPPTLAPWMTRDSATPPARWFAAYHGKENTAPLIARAYAALRIPEANVRVWTAEPAALNGPNPYHGVGISRQNTPENFAFMFGLASSSQ
ncbi:MAG: hypothetical protein JNK75_14195 [Betaproteobacteria bacterium]|nr:hypothetical protein [Betaproteobacteria bacterium]